MLDKQVVGATRRMPIKKEKKGEVTLLTLFFSFIGEPAEGGRTC